MCARDGKAAIDDQRKPFRCDRHVRHYPLSLELRDQSIRAIAGAGSHVARYTARGVCDQAAASGGFGLPTL